MEPLAIFQLRIPGESGDSPMTWVFQFKPLASTCSRSRTSGVTAATSFKRAMSRESPSVRVGALPQPPRMPPRVKLPEKTVTTFSPRLETWSSTWRVAPLVRLTDAITAPTPMMMPSMVSKERILLRRRARAAIFREAIRRMLKVKSRRV